MKKRTRFIATLTMFAALATPLPAFAEPRGGPDKRQDEPRRPDDRRPDGRPGKDQPGRDQPGRDQPAPKRADEKPELPRPNGHFAPPPAIKGAREKLAQDRDARRDREREEAQRRYGELLAKPAVRDEMARHNRRVAQIDYLDQLAKAKGKSDLVTRIAALLTKEAVRHEKRMQALRVSGG